MPSVAKMRSRLDTTKPRNELITRPISTEPSNREFAQKVNGDLDLSSRIGTESRNWGIKTASFLGIFSFRINTIFVYKKSLKYINPFLLTIMQ